MSLIISELLCKLDHQTQVAEKALSMGAIPLLNTKKLILDILRVGESVLPLLKSSNHTFLNYLTILKT